MRQWQQRTVRIDAGGVPLQDRPQAFDVRAQRLSGRWHVGGCIAGYVEAGRDEIAQRVAGLSLCGLPVGQYGRRRLARYSVGKRLLVGKQMCSLHLLEQRSQLLVGRRWRDSARLCCHRYTCRQQCGQHQPGGTASGVTHGSLRFRQQAL